jgi:hypothetical protein
MHDIASHLVLLRFRSLLSLMAIWEQQGHSGRELLAFIHDASGRVQGE